MTIFDEYMDRATTEIANYKASQEKIRLNHKRRLAKLTKIRLIDQEAETRQERIKSTIYRLWLQDHGVKIHYAIKLPRNLDNIVVYDSVVEDRHLYQVYYFKDKKLAMLFKLTFS